MGGECPLWVWGSWEGQLSWGGGARGSLGRRQEGSCGLGAPPGLLLPPPLPMEPPQHFLTPSLYSSSDPHSPLAPPRLPQTPPILPPKPPFSHPWRTQRPPRGAFPPPATRGRCATAALPHESAAERRNRKCTLSGSGNGLQSPVLPAAAAGRCSASCWGRPGPSRSPMASPWCSAAGPAPASQTGSAPGSRVRETAAELGEGVGEGGVPVLPFLISSPPPQWRSWPITLRAPPRSRRWGVVLAEGVGGWDVGGGPWGGSLGYLRGV